MTFTSHTLHTSRKHHICNMCGGTISPGAQYWRMAGKWEGDFFAGKAHTDCRDMWNAAYPIYADMYGDGMCWDLHDAIVGDECPDIMAVEFNAWRGRFPHVICRMELRMTQSAWRHIDRMRAEGFDYHPEPHEELYS